MLLLSVDEKWLEVWVYMKSGTAVKGLIDLDLEIKKKKKKGKLEGRVLGKRHVGRHMGVGTQHKDLFFRVRAYQND